MLGPRYLAQIIDSKNADEKVTVCERKLKNEFLYKLLMYFYISAPLVHKYNNSLVKIDFQTKLNIFPL